MIDVQSKATYFNNTEEELNQINYIWNLTSIDKNLIVLIVDLISNNYSIYQFNEEDLNDLLEFKSVSINKTPTEVVYST